MKDDSSCDSAGRKDGRKEDLSFEVEGQGQGGDGSDW